MKKIIIFFLTLGVIVFSFLMPKLLFQIEDLAKEKEIFSREKIKSKIDVEAEKIYLVKIIHELYDNTLINMVRTDIAYYDRNEKIVEADNSMYRNVLSKETEEILKNNEDIDKLNDEIRKMENINILDGINIYDNARYSIRYYGRDYFDKLIKNIDIIFSDYSMNFELENKTGKIIMMSIPKNLVKNIIDKKELLENYIKYLDLYIIDDWKFENRNTSTNIKFDYLMSEKARLLSAIIETDEEYIISLQTIERFEDLFSEVKRNNSDTN